LISALPGWIAGILPDHIGKWLTWAYLGLLVLITVAMALFGTGLAVGSAVIILPIIGVIFLVGLACGAFTRYIFGRIAK